MIVYTLVGKSGTGKSYHAMSLCKKLGVEAIIDDGLFIYKNSVVAGVSAKRAETKIGAIKMAMFLDDDLRDQVADAIKKENPSSILILGTSVGMVDKIIERLGLPSLPEDSDRRIKIEDITTENERKTARHQRMNLGKHIIPAPTMQLKRSFAGYFLDPLRFFRDKEQGAAAERTVVRPTYSYLGEFFISEKVIDDIVNCIATMTPGIARVINIFQIPKPDAYKLKIAIKIKKGFPIWNTAENFQKVIQKQIEEMTAFHMMEIELEVRGTK
jgi:adenylate kinase family enzyme